MNQYNIKNDDHKIPYSRGGLHEISNLVVCCTSCNASKGNRTPEEYIAYREEVRKLVLT